MSVLDERLEWKQTAVNMSAQIHYALKPILEDVLRQGMTLEDFYYLVGDTAETLVLERRRCDRKARAYE